MERAAAEIESAIGVEPSTPFIMTDGPSLREAGTPHPVERFPIIAGSGGRPTGSRRTSRLHAVLSITVSADQLLGVRRAVVALGHPAVDLLTVTPLPGGSRVRLTAYLASDVVDVLTQRILEFVAARNPGAECTRNSQQPENAPRSETSTTIA